MAVGVGVGLALAKVELDRRAALARERRERRPSLLRGESAAAGVRRVALGQLDLAIELLDDYPRAACTRSDSRGAAGDSIQADEWTVHEVRKALKRLRALLRLLRHELGRKRFARENAVLRDCARRLAGARDAEVLLSTLEALLERHSTKLAASPGVRLLRAQLRAERDRAAAAIRDPSLRRAIADDLRAVRGRVAGWELTARDAKLIEPGLERLYRQGRRNLRGARRRKDIETLHRWRKRVKDLRYAAETLDRGNKRVRRVARRADRLGEVLGEEHDLGILARAVRARPEHFAGDRRARKTLLKAISRRRSELRDRALRDGERLYKRSARAFVRRLRDY